MKVFALIYAEYTNSNEIFYYFMLDFGGFLFYAILCYFILFHSNFWLKKTDKLRQTASLRKINWEIFRVLKDTQRETRLKK